MNLKAFKAIPVVATVGAAFILAPASLASDELSPEVVGAFELADSSRNAESAALDPVSMKLYSEYAIVAPEPRSALILAMGVMGLMARRGKQA